MFLKIFGVKILCWNKIRLLQICKFGSVYVGVESQYLKSHEPNGLENLRHRRGYSV